jgi:membrane protease YdiL (CAAX protease family)
MLPYIRAPSAALPRGCPATVALMSAVRRWSLIVPVVGVVVAVLLLPVVADPVVPDSLRAVLSYLVAWVPLVAASIVAVCLAVRRRTERWWLALRLPVSATGVVVGVFVGLATRTIAVVAEAITTGRIGAGSLTGGGGDAGAGPLILVVVASALVAPVIEEVFFRGAFLPAVTQRLGAGRGFELIAIAIVSVAFAGVHAAAGGSALTIVVTLIAGVGFGLAARSYGVGSAIVAHVVFNSTGLALIASASGLSPLYPTLALG